MKVKIKNMEMLSPQEYYNGLPKKPVGASVLFFNEAGELLIVKPNYKNNWLIVGGTIEAGESPSEGARREVLEELGLEIEKLTLICLDWGKTAEGDYFKFMFSGGVLNNDKIAKIRLQESELVEFKFAAIEAALEMLSNSMSRRLPECVEAIRSNQFIYLENGKKI